MIYFTNHPSLAISRGACVRGSQSLVLVLYDFVISSMLAKVVSDIRTAGASDRLANAAESSNVITSFAGFRWLATPREETGFMLSSKLSRNNITKKLCTNYKPKPF